MYAIITKVLWENLKLEPRLKGQMPSPKRTAIKKKSRIIAPTTNILLNFELL